MTAAGTGDDPVGGLVEYGLLLDGIDTLIAAKSVT